MIYLLHIPDTGISRREYSKTLHSQSHALLKYALARHGIHGFDPDTDIEKNSFGKPYLKNNPLFFNISHCHGLAVCGIHNDEIGIDAENIRSFSPKIPGRIFTPSEMEFLNNSSCKNEAFFRLWTLKESYIKNIGIGLSFPLKNIEFDISDNITGSDKDKIFTQFSLKHFIISVCTGRSTDFDNSITIVNAEELIP